MKRNTTPTRPDSKAMVTAAWEAVGASFERFCLTAGVATLSRMMEEDATALCGRRHEHSDGRVAYRWGRTKGRIGFHGGRIEVKRPRVRARSGAEAALPAWETALAEDWLGQWAMNLMLIIPGSSPGTSTRKFGRAVRLPGGDVPVIRGDGGSKSAVSRRRWPGRARPRRIGETVPPSRHSAASFSASAAAFNEAAFASTSATMWSTIDALSMVWSVLPAL